MTNLTDNQNEPESLEKLLHDIATPLLIAQMNNDLLAKYLPQLIEMATNAQTKNVLFSDEKIAAALLSSPNAIKNNLGTVQKKIRQLTNLLENNQRNTASDHSISLANIINTAPAKPATGKINAILIVDDEAIHQDIGISLLTPQYHVETANNGLEAISKCQQKHYDLILMDLQMPKMNGVEATEKLRKTISINTMIIGLTSMPIENKRAELLELGFNNFLEKPLKLEKFQNILRLHAIND